MEKRAKRGRCEIGPILADDLTNEQLNKLAGVKFTPKPAQLVYARAYVSAAPKDTLRAIAELSGVPFETVRNWRRQPRFLVWLADVAIFAVGTVMGRVWRAVADKAAEGNIPAAKMLALRFDREFGDAIAHREPPKPEHTDAELAEIAAAAAKAEPAEGLALDPLALVTGASPETGPDTTLERNEPQSAPKVPRTAEVLPPSGISPSLEIPRGAGGEGQARGKHNMSLPPATHGENPDTPAVSSGADDCLAPGTIIPCFDTGGVRLGPEEDS